ncbi:MAG TPA: bacterioferritin-associated ferredoxin [Solimonas sp.]|nr:bacterioferritin-associated ferredoxin [Solimonas sp.]
MIVCVCKAVSEKRIRAAASDGVTTLRELTRELGVGTCCGKCVPHAREVLMETLQSRGPGSDGRLGGMLSAAM